MRLDQAIRYHVTAMELQRRCYAVTHQIHSSAWGPMKLKITLLGAASALTLLASSAHAQVDAGAPQASQVGPQVGRGQIGTAGAAGPAPPARGAGVGGAAPPPR